MVQRERRWGGVGGIMNWRHLHGSLTHAGLVSQVELGDSETPADLLYLGEKAPVRAGDSDNNM